MWIFSSVHSLLGWKESINPKICGSKLADLSPQPRLPLKSLSVNSSPLAAALTGKYVMVMGIIQAISPEPVIRAVKMADLSELAALHRRMWKLEVDDLQQVLSWMLGWSAPPPVLVTYYWSVKCYLSRLKRWLSCRLDLFDGGQVLKWLRKLVCVAPNPKLSLELLGG